MSRQTQAVKQFRAKMLDFVRMVIAPIHGSKQTSVDIEVKDTDIRTMAIWHGYGLTSHVPADGTALLVFPSGDSTDGAAILLQVDGAPTLEKGEVALWNTKGAIIKLKADGTIEITGNVVVKGDIEATNITATGDVKAGQISLKTHTHMTPQGISGAPLL